MRMNFTLVMDRDIDVNKHYISPGGYEIEFSNGKSIEFDFYASYGNINKDNPSEVDFEVCDLDTESFQEAKNLSELLSKYNIHKFNEFFIYTGEYNDPEIYAIRVKNLSIEDENKIYKFKDFNLTRED